MSSNEMLQAELTNRSKLEVLEDGENILRGGTPFVDSNERFLSN